MFARDLHAAIEARNLTDIVDVVFVSDHGMTDTSHPELVYIDDILGDGFTMIEHEDGQGLHHGLSLTRLNHGIYNRMAVDGSPFYA